MFSSQGTRKRMEDFHYVEEGKFFSIFDGFKGTNASEYISANLPKKLIEKNTEDLNEIV